MLKAFETRIETHVILLSFWCIVTMNEIINLWKNMLFKYAVFSDDNDERYETDCTEND